MSFRGAVLNEYDRPSYEFTLPAPLGGMTYSFLFETKDGELVQSPDYTITRSCTPDTSLTDGQISPELSGTERVDHLSKTASKLENELESYATTLQLLETLEEKLRDEP
jgi:hypothetical protein